MQHPRDLARQALPTLRTPVSEDGSGIWELVRACKPLDENSMYCNLLQCDHFSDTCVVADMGGEAIGWVSAYILPNDPETLFVWQVAVSEKARGMGLGGKMLAEILVRDVCADVTRLQTTITSDNKASWGLFRKFARNQGGSLSSEPHFTREDHFAGRAATENMVTIEMPNPVAQAA